MVVLSYGPYGVYYEGSPPKKIRVKRETEFNTLLNGLYPIFGLAKQRSKIEIFGRYPAVVSPDFFTYVHFPVVNYSSLETMLEVLSNHPSIKNVELYLEVKSTSDDVADPAACSSAVENPASSSKRQRTQQPHEATGYVSHPSVKVERNNGLEVQGVDNSNGWIEDEENSDFGNGSTHGGGDGEMTNKNSGSDRLVQVVNLTASNSNADLNKGVEPRASKPWSLSSLWVDDHELRVGLCFKDRNELKKAVDWCSIRGRQNLFACRR